MPKSVFLPSFKVCHIPRIVVGLIILGFLLAHLTGYTNIRTIDKFERLVYDIRLKSTLPKGIDPRIVIVDIDEKSLDSEGQWPWRRDRLKTLLDHLFDDYHIAIAGFNIIFAENEKNSDLDNIRELAENDQQTAVIDYLKQIQPKLDRNRIFADGLKNRPVVLGYYFNAHQNDMGNIGSLPPPVFPSKLVKGNITHPLKMQAYTGNLPELQTHTHSAGFFQNDRIDDDGLIRRVPMLVEYNEQLYESLSLAMVRTLLNDVPVLPVFSDVKPELQAVEYLQLGDFLLPVDEMLSSLVPYRGSQGSFRYISASDVLNKTANADSLKNAIVLIGTTAPGLMELRSTPVQKLYPGVEIHANMIAGILDQRIKRQSSYIIAYELVYLALMGLTLIFLFPLLSLEKLIITSLLAALLSVLSAAWLWEEMNLVMNVVPSLLLITLLFILNMAHGFYVETKSKRKLGKLFGEYIPPTVVKEMDINPNAVRKIAVNREMTVLFSDIRNFTSISEGLSPEELSELMNTFLTPLTRVIHNNQGTIDKYMGDAVMAFWGAPIADESHAKHAVDTGMLMLKEMKNINVECKKRGWPTLRIGCGLSTGNMSVGNMGSEYRRAYTVLGDAVNLGERCESVTVFYGVDFIVSENTKNAVPEYAYRELDLVKLKGKSNAVHLFEPIALVSNVSEDQAQELAQYHEALRLYREQQWDLAKAIFLELKKSHGKKMIYDIYLNRIDQFKANTPPDSWRAIHTHSQFNAPPV